MKKSILSVKNVSEISPSYQQRRQWKPQIVIYYWMEEDVLLFLGSSIAGVLRDYYSKRTSAADANELFGYVSGEILANSHVIVSDGNLERLAAAGDYRITVRDGIRFG